MTTQLPVVAPPEILHCLSELEPRIQSLLRAFIIEQQSIATRATELLDARHKDSAGHDQELRESYEAKIAVCNQRGDAYRNRFSDLVERMGHEIQNTPGLPPDCRVRLMDKLAACARVTTAAEVCMREEMNEQP